MEALADASADFCTRSGLRPEDAVTVAAWLRWLLRASAAATFAAVADEPLFCQVLEEHWRAAALVVTAVFPVDTFLRSASVVWRVDKPGPARAARRTARATAPSPVRSVYLVADVGPAMAALAAACADPRWQSAVVGEDSWLGAPRALLMLGRMLLAAGCPADAVRRVTAMEDNTVPITAAWVVSLNFHLPKTYVPGDTPARRVHRPALRRAVAALLEVAVKHMRAAPDELEALARAALPRIRDDVVGHAEAFLVAGVMIGDALAHRRGMRAVGHLPRTQADLFVSRLRPFHLASSSLRGFSPTFTEEALGTVVHIGHAAEAAVWHLESYGRSNWTTLIGTSAAAAAAGGAPPAAAVARTIAANPRGLPAAVAYAHLRSFLMLRTPVVARTAAEWTSWMAYAWSVFRVGLGGRPFDYATVAHYGGLWPKACAGDADAQAAMRALVRAVLLPSVLATVDADGVPRLTRQVVYTRTFSVTAAARDAVRRARPDDSDVQRVFGHYADSPFETRIVEEEYPAVEAMLAAIADPDVAIDDRVAMLRGLTYKTTYARDAPAAEAVRGCRHRHTIAVGEAIAAAAAAHDGRAAIRWVGPAPRRRGRNETRGHDETNPMQHAQPGLDEADTMAYIQ
jgi:hypothetical protein